MGLAMLDAAAVLHPGRLFHTGLVVVDIERAMAELSGSLGVTWKGGWPAMHRLHYFGTGHEVELRIAFSVEGPPHIELIEAKEGTIWPPEECGLHHLCYWSPTPEASAEALEAQGYTRLMGEPGSAGGYFRGPAGLAVEVLTEQYHDQLAAWLARPARSRA